MIYKQKSSESPFEGGQGDDPSISKADILILLRSVYLILDFFTACRNGILLIFYFQLTQNPVGSW